MKKAFLLASILFISVISTACINNFAVQELNNKAKSFMEQSDYISAIERLKSSIDLDASVFETQYNLAVAYTKAEDYLNAIKTYKIAIDLNPDFSDTYYSLAVCEENLSRDILSGNVIVNEDGSIQKKDSLNEQISSKKDLSEVASKFVKATLEEAIKDYNLYLDKNSTAEDREDVENKINDLKLLSDENR